MSLRSHLLHRGTGQPEAAPPGRAAGSANSDIGQRPDRQPGPGGRVYFVQRVGAIAVGVFLLVFGVLGFAGGLAFFSTNGQHILGLSSNGLLSALSVVTAVVLFGADVRGPRVASTVMMVLGALFLLSALVNLAVLRTSFNFLAFEVSNVLFSIGVGLVLLILGAYGRVSGNLPPDSPYAHLHGDAEPPEAYPSTPEEFAAEAEMREAEIAVLEHRATADQRRRVQAMAQVRTRADRRRVWMTSAPPPDPVPPPPGDDHRAALGRTAEWTRGRRHREE
jgi:Domain of unknown function (DUF4383)